MYFSIDVYIVEWPRILNFYIITNTERKWLGEKNTQSKLSVSKNIITDPSWNSHSANMVTAPF
jgi:hypothetical protein